MIGLIRRWRTSMALSIIGSVAALLCIFALVISFLGYRSFADTFRNELATTTYHMADTAAALINDDHLGAYLAGGQSREYKTTAATLDAYCKRMGVSMIYVILVDRSDYGRFVCVFNAVNNELDDTDYTPWPMGYIRETTNGEYREKYRAIYEQQVPYETVYRTNPRDGQRPHITTMVPVRDAAGTPVAILCMQRPMRELTEASRSYAVSIALTAVLLAVLSGLSIALYLRKQVVQPVRKVSEEAVRFSRENTIGKPLGSISRYREITGLAASIDTMEAEMVRYIDNLTAFTAEKERIGAELSLARTIQENSLPNVFPAFPERRDFDIRATMTPAREVGGDFYNFFLIDGDHLGVVIGDVSGKGVPAALFEMVVNIYIRERAMGGGTPGEILAYVNGRICERNQAEMFVTVWLGVLELSTGRLTAANAGHEYPVLRRAGGPYELLKDPHGLVIGGMEGMRYRDYEIRMSPGDRLFVYTDGVPEATGAARELFGTDRMLAALNAVPQASPEETLKAVRGAVDAFVQDAEQFDDLTMLCLDYNGPV